MIYLNGAIVAGDAAKLDVADRGLLLGDGLFETIRVYAGRPFRLQDHVVRLKRGAAALGIPFHGAAASVAQAVDDVLAANRLADAEASVRITLTRGPGPRGLLPPQNPQPTFLATAAALAASPPDAMSAVVVSVRRNEGSSLSRLKTLNYLDNILALREAAAAGADEAVMLNNHGYVACGARSNIFAVIGDALVTPPLEDGVLDGVTRRIVLEIARDMNLPVAERSVTQDDLRRADEIFLTNSLMEIMPIGRIDDREMPVRRIAAKMRQRYRLLINPN